MKKLEKLVIINPEALKAILKAVKQDLNEWNHRPNDNYHGAKAEDVEKAIQYLEVEFS